MKIVRISCSSCERSRPQGYAQKSWKAPANRKFLHLALDLLTVCPALAFFERANSDLLLALVVIGCGGNGDQPDKVVRGYLQSEESASCQYLTAPQEKLCRRPHAPDPRAGGIVIERIRIQGDRATIRASYAWGGYRRRSTFALVRRGDGWLIAKETPD
jgi:hypothetical protein